MWVATSDESCDPILAGWPRENRRVTAAYERHVTLTQPKTIVTSESESISV
jgi:hypothetical protein